MERTTFHVDELVVGERVSFTRTGEWGSTTGSGVFIGVALDEEDGVPCYYFVDGELNGHAQRSFGFAADPGAEVTTALTPTMLIREAIGGDDALELAREIRCFFEGEVGAGDEALTYWVAKARELEARLEGAS